MVTDSDSSGLVSIFQSATNIRKDFKKLVVISQPSTSNFYGLLHVLPGTWRHFRGSNPETDAYKDNFHDDKTVLHLICQHERPGDQRAKDLSAPKTATSLNIIHNHGFYSH